MKAQIQKDKKRRKLAEKYETKRAALKSIHKDESLSLLTRWKAVHKLAELPRDSSTTRVRNRCLLTGRPRGTLRDFKMSRIKFRELASSGLLNGVRKASW